MTLKRKASSVTIKDDILPEPVNGNTARISRTVTKKSTKVETTDGKKLQASSEVISVVKKQKVERVTIPRSPTARWVAGDLPKGRKLLRLLSWNVAGLRAVLRKEDSCAAIKALLEKEKPHILCLQETKLQSHHVDEIADDFKQLFEGYTALWSCSEAKKGYSGTCILLSESVPGKVKSVRYGIGQSEADLEGRAITMEFDWFYLVNTYVPNAGENLKRLDYRVKTWDPSLVAHLKSLESKGKPVILGGDLNVAHQDIDFFNPEEPRMKKAAGTTPEERGSFGEVMLGDGGFIDTFRWRHPEATGVYR